MFQPRFAALVLAGRKHQTIRPTPKRPLRAGDRLSLRQWTGKPYRSKQRVLRDVVCAGVSAFTLDLCECCMSLEGLRLGSLAQDNLARMDGFENAYDMRIWFGQNHSFPFNGILIRWV